MKTFQELGISPNILKAIAKMGYENPMPIQEKVIPYLLNSGSEVIALAETGTGKTAAFGIPIIQQIQVCYKHPQAIIICPTRELCIQIANDINNYSRYLKRLKILPIYGGSSIENQIKILQKGVHIIVATPGRLIDLINRKTVNLQHISNIVLDEADEMLSMGFYESIDEILYHIPKNRNILFFSATMPQKIVQITKKYMQNPYKIIIGEKNSGPNNIQHVYYIANTFDKYSLLKRVVDYYPGIYGIIFCRTKNETKKITNLLVTDAYNVDSLHGDLSQMQRDYVMQKFRARSIQLLVATDVAARGLDVNNLSHIINYDLPDDVESYIHRSGRTGRAGKTGISVSIIYSKEIHKIIAIEKNIDKKFDKISFPSGKEICRKQFFYFIEELERTETKNEEIENILHSLYIKLSQISKEDLIKKLISNKFAYLINYYQNTDNDTKILQKRNKKNNYNLNKKHIYNSKRLPKKGYTLLSVNLGKINGLVQSKLIKLLNDNIPGHKISIGKISLMKNLSYFEVKNIDKNRIIKNLNNIEAFGEKIIIKKALKNAERI
ncbi:MAG: DEAD/DEAH box helicase [Bacteroidales bacterium OttesenSCG-928-I14]|nr:DEAD/DEAH box helicase [Bacteroidales bacterium OttesenSCG-928-I14]